MVTSTSEVLSPHVTTPFLRPFLFGTLFFKKYTGITPLVVIDLVLVLFCSVHRHGRFSSRCDFHLATSFHRVKRGLKVSEHIFEMLAFMGMLLVSYILLVS